MYIPTTLAISVLKGNANKEGLIPILLKFTQNRKTHRISLRKWIQPESWVNERGKYVKEKGAGASDYAKQLNAFLNSQINRGKDILLTQERRNLPITFHQFKAEFINQQDQDFIAFCEQELNRREESDNYSRETLRSNWSKLNKLKKFRSHLSFHDLTIAFLESYQHFMETKLHNDTNTIFGAMKFVRTMLNAARKKSITDVYPFAQYKITYKKDTRDRLNGEELGVLQEIYESDTLSRSLQNVLEYFLFACYSGLTWSDLESLDYSEIEKRGQTYLISKRRKKTSSPFVVPLMDKARRLINLSKEEGQVFPNMLTNQKSNVAIKKVIERTKIRKHVTFHVARHTFGTVALNNGIPREVVQKMLGHVTSQQTELYAKVLDSYIIKEMKKWDDSIASPNYYSNLDKESCAIYKKLLTKIVATRITSGLSEAQIAEKIGLSESYYQKIEKGDAQLGVGELIALSKQLEINLTSLFIK